MLLTVVTGLSLIGTPAPYQTWYGATAGAGPGGTQTTAPEVTRLTVTGTPGLPLLAADAGVFANKTASDTLAVSITELGRGSSSRTWTFSGSAEGWADLDLHEYYATFAYSGLSGNPAGALRADWLASGANTVTEAARVSFAWTDLGVPPARAVTHVECISLDARVAAASYITTQDILLQLTDAAGSTLAPDLLREPLPEVAGEWEVYTGRGERAVDGPFQPSDTVVYARATWDVTRSVMAGTARTWFDNIELVAYWTGIETEPTPTEAITELKLNALPGGPIWDPTGREVSDQVAKATTDTLFVVILEEPVDEQEIFTQDTLRTSLTESRLLSAVLGVADTLSVRFASETGGVVTSGGAPVPIVAEDSVRVVITESAGVAVAHAVTDTITASITDASALAELSLELKTASDTLSVALLEQYTLQTYDGQVELNVADELFVRFTDGALLTATGVVSVIELYPDNPSIEVWPANEH